MQEQMPEAPGNSVTKRMLRRLNTDAFIPAPERHYVQLQMDWYCRSTNRWTYASRNASGTPGVVHVTSGAFRTMDSRESVVEALHTLLNQLAEFYDFGAQVPYAGEADDSRSVIQVMRNSNGLPIGLRIVDDPAVNEFQFLCNLTVYMIRPGSGGLGVGCYKEPQSLAEKTLHTLLNKKHSVVMIKNDDDSCFARCLAVLLTKAYCVLKQGDSSIEKQGSTRISMETCVALDGVFERLDETIRRRNRHIGDM